MFIQSVFLKDSDNKHLVSKQLNKILKYEESYIDATELCVELIDLLAILQQSLDRAIFLYFFIREVQLSGVRASIAIEDCAKDGGEEFLPRCTAFEVQIFKRFYRNSIKERSAPR